MKSRRYERNKKSTVLPDPAWTNHNILFGFKPSQRSVIVKSFSVAKGIFRTKHPTQVMVLGVEASDRKKKPLHFFKPVENMGAEVYYKVLQYKVIPWLKVNSTNGILCGPRMVLCLIQ